MPTRRSLLRTGGLAGLGTLAAIAALPSPRESPDLDGTVEGSDVDLPESVAPWLEAGESITDEADAPIARYQYEAIPDDGAAEYGPTSPINVVLVPAEGGAERVVDALEDAGWLRGPEEYTRYAWDRTAGRYVRQEATAAETYYGTSGRFHVRCWSFEGVVSMQVHEDTAARPDHGIASYERGRRAIERIYAAADWSIAPDRIDLGNAHGPDHDGRATVIAEDVP